MSKFGFLSTSVSRSDKLRDADLRQPRTQFRNVLPDPLPPPQPSTFRLMGETLSSPDVAAAAFKKGPFMYQVRNSSGSDNPLRYCRTEDDLYVLQDRLLNGRTVVIRHLRPDPLPPAPPVYVSQSFTSWW